MKKAIYLSLALLLIFSKGLFAQSTPTAAGLTEATLTLTNGNIVKGYGENLISSRRAIAFRSNADAKKQLFSAKQIQSAQLNQQYFQVIVGDFFQVHTRGDTWELCEKLSASPATIEYNGAEPIMVSSSPGAVGDLFLYNSSNHQLISVKEPFAKKYLKEKLVASNSSLAPHVLKTLQNQ
jgi:hypothetical protein